MASRRPELTMIIRLWWISRNSRASKKRRPEAHPSWDDMEVLNDFSISKLTGDVAWSGANV